MKPPPFVTLVNDAWCLAGDNSITVEVSLHGRLAWDDTFQKVISRLHQRQGRGVVVDVGAYIGDSTRWFIAHGFPTIAFEPQPDAFLCLSRNCPEATLFNFPVGNGERVQISNAYSGNLGARSTVEDPSGVPTIRIDDLEIADVALLKIDVEGAEPNVLAGATETIRRCNPIIVCEINPKALRTHGFGVEDVMKHFEGWAWEEVFRYYDENWDIILTR